MISYLSGTLLLVESPTIVLLTPAGIGYDVELPNRLFAGLPTVGAHLQLHTHLVVREDAQLLYGFLNRTDRALFRQLLKVSGVGAKLALALLGQYEAVDLIEIVLRQDKTALSKVSGVGKKPQNDWYWNWPIDSLHWQHIRPPPMMMHVLKLVQHCKH